MPNVDRSPPPPIFVEKSSSTSRGNGFFSGPGCSDATSSRMHVAGINLFCRIKRPM